jgi:lantibiotic modifying enzyme
VPGLGPGWWRKAVSPREQPVDSAPEWSALAEQAVTSAPPAITPENEPSLPEALSLPLDPFVTHARQQVISEARRYLGPADADLVAVGRAFGRVLAGQLARIAARTLSKSTSSGLADLFTQFPVLARMLAGATLAATDATAELLARFAADRHAVAEQLLPGLEPGPIVAVTPGLGDPHCHGRTVSLVQFADGRTVVYKPRSLDAQARFGEAVRWFNDRIADCGLRAPKVLTRAGYGWVEFVPPRPLERLGDARRFYRRAGILLAVLYGLGAVDMHCENVIACCDQPIVIDAETLLHPILPRSEEIVPDPAAQALAASVMRTSFLPYVTVAETDMLDLSGLGGDPDVGAFNRPRLGGRLIEPADYEADLLDGFRLGYDTITRNRAEFTAFLTGCADLETRVVMRPSRGYKNLLEDATEPDLLRDARDRDQALAFLGSASTGHRLRQQLVSDEHAALWRGDLPLFTGRPAATDLWACSGRRLRDVLEGSALDAALTRVAAMGDIDRSEQEWLISASLASRRPVGGHQEAPPTTGLTPATAATARVNELLAAAGGLADQIVARGATLPGEGEEGRVNWLGLQPVEDTRWMVMPMGASLADGYIGVALFLAQLSQLVGITRYAQVARRALSPVPHLLAALQERPDLIQAVGCGGYEGLGGMSYGLARLANLLEDPLPREWAAAAVGLAARALGQPGEADGWADGLAGCLAAMSAVHAETGLDSAMALARTCADRLATLAEDTDGWCASAGVPPARGFAVGPAGVGWALAQFARETGNPRYAGPADRVLRRVGEELAVSAAIPSGWCRGIAGLLTAQTAGDQSERQAAARSLVGRPILSDLSLCHGELGITEALTVLVSPGPDTAIMQVRSRYAGFVLNVLRHQDQYCAPPGGISTPGLLHGLAGIGYGLLRLGFPGRVPSVLLLEPGQKAS